jgi:putative ABC transport system ATP-binding protein
MADRLALAVEGVSKSYGKGSAKVTALKDVTVNVEHGELVALLGPSGSGKSTLLHIMGLIERPDEGRVILNGSRVSTDEKPWLVRGRRVAIVYQAYNLVSRLTTLENVALPLVVRGITPRKANEEAVAKLRQVGLVSKVRSRPGELSGGEQQRVAIARATASEAEYILADEPTGNLDSENGKRIVELLSELGETDRGVLIATHDLDLAAMADRVIRIKDGKIVTHEQNVIE